MRKSLAKKDSSTYSWFCCAKCDRKLVKSNVKNHENNCDLSKINYIEKEKFFGQKSALKFALPDSVEISAIPKSILQNYVFVPEQLGQICGVKLGDLLVVSLNGKSYVKKNWTILDSSASLEVIYGICDGKKFPVLFINNQELSFSKNFRSSSGI